MNKHDLFNKCIPEPNSGCWLWYGSVKDENNLYGITTHEGKRWKSHRLSYFLHYGEIPDGMHVLHKCDNPLCCNPDHLFIGTHIDNMRDCKRKNRFNGLRGELGTATKLSNSDVSEIKNQLSIFGKKYGTLTRLANQYGVTHKTISKIRDGETWIHHEI